MAHPVDFIPEEDHGKYVCWNDLNKKCMGKECMAWSWQVIPLDPAAIQQGRTLPNQNYVRTGLGYCGMQIVNFMQKESPHSN